MGVEGRAPGLRVGLAPRGLRTAPFTVQTFAGGAGTCHCGEI